MPRPAGQRLKLRPLTRQSQRASSRSAHPSLQTMHDKPVPKTHGSAASRAFAQACSHGQSGKAGKMEGNEHATSPPLPGNCHPSASHPLPALRPHPRLPPRQHQRGADRALPPGPPRGTRPPSITEPVPTRLAISPQTSASPARTCVGLGPQVRQRSQSVFTALGGERAKSRRSGALPGCGDGSWTVLSVGGSALACTCPGRSVRAARSLEAA
jgi:hypothetical protein